MRINQMSSLFPVRCFSCGAVIRWNKYENELKKGIQTFKILDNLGIIKPCCRRMFKGHIPELEKYYNGYNPSARFCDGKTSCV